MFVHYFAMPFCYINTSVMHSQCMAVLLSCDVHVHQLWLKYEQCLLVSLMRSILSFQMATRNHMPISLALLFLLGLILQTAGRPKVVEHWCTISNYGTTNDLQLCCCTNVNLVCLFPAASCPSDQFECDNGRCIGREWICNKYDDCRDGSDKPPKLDCCKLALSLRLFSSNIPAVN